MPQASGEVARAIDRIFGKGTYPDDAKPSRLLFNCGWTLDGRGTWRSPKPLEDVSEHEYICLRFLIEEWDYGYEGEEENANHAEQSQ